MVVFAIKNGKKYLQRFDANENYKNAVRAIQTCAHLPSEFVPVWGESPNWMDCRTAGGYLRDLAHCISRNNMNIRHLSIEIGNE